MKKLNKKLVNAVAYYIADALLEEYSEKFSDAVSIYIRDYDLGLSMQVIMDNEELYDSFCDKVKKQVTKLL